MGLIDVSFFFRYKVTGTGEFATVGLCSSSNNNKDGEEEVNFGVFDICKNERCTVIGCAGNSFGCIGFSSPYPNPYPPPWSCPHSTSYDIQAYTWFAGESVDYYIHVRSDGISNFTLTARGGVTNDITCEPSLMPSIAPTTTPDIIIPSSRTYTVDPWQDGLNYPSFTAVVGDTIIFKYDEGSNHDVWIHPDGTCTDIFEEQSALSPPPFRVKGNIGPGIYTFGDDDGDASGKSILFTCDLGSLHCENGQYLKVIVFDTHENRDRIQSGPDPYLPDIPPPSKPSTPTDDSTDIPSMSPTEGCVKVGQCTYNSDCCSGRCVLSTCHRIRSTQPKYTNKLSFNRNRGGAAGGSIIPRRRKYQLRGR